MTTPVTKNPKDKMILVYFIAFFGVVIAVNAVFITLAISTHSGVVTENAYQKGIDFNQALAQAKSQPEMIDNFSFENGTLAWQLNSQHQKPLENAQVTARLFRPVQSGHDFDIKLEHKGNGLYEAAPDFPMMGLWQVQLKATWNTHETYQKTTSITVK